MSPSLPAPSPRPTAYLRLVALSALAAGCTVASPMTGPGWDGDALLTDAEGPFVAVATHTRIAKGEGAAFDDHVDAITAQLDGQEGFVARSLRAKLPGRERWTLTVWEDEESLAAFVVGGAHADAMGDSATVIEGLYSVSWTVEPDAMPIEWGDVLDRLAAVEPDPAW